MQQTEASLPQVLCRVTPDLVLEAGVPAPVVLPVTSGPQASLQSLPCWRWVGWFIPSAAVSGDCDK